MSITRVLIASFLSVAAVFVNTSTAEENAGKVFSTVTTADKSKLLEETDIPFDAEKSTDNLIELNPKTEFQEMDGFGVAITGSSCYNLLKMTEADRKKLLEEVFSPKTGLGYGYIRISIGCSDFSLSEFTCCDEPGIENFAIHEEDEKYLIPILKEILKINPGLKIMGSPWTCPIWMKVENLKDLKPFPSWKSGQLNPKHYQDYADYFVKYIRAMKERGIELHSITIQNEPLNRGNSASLFMTWQEQKEFIKTALGPKFREAKLETEIIVFDHNYNYDSQKPDCKDQIGYPLHIYEDEEAAQYVTGAAYHAYGGNVAELDRIHAAFPDKNIYFTEMSIGEWNYSFNGDLMWCMREVGLGTINRHSKAVILWNLMLDDKHRPFRPGGCSICMGAIDIDSSDYKTLERKSHYYVIGHLSKVVSPGAKRIETKGYTERGLHYSGFKNPDGRLSLVVLNDTSRPIRASVGDGERTFKIDLPAKSVGSYKWELVVSCFTI